MSGTYAVKRPVAWVGGIILVALIVLAIVLPITARKKEDIIERHHQSYLTPYDPFKDDLLAEVEDEDDQQEILDIVKEMTDDQLRGYINVYPHKDDLTGNPAPDAPDFETLATEGKLGAILNFEKVEEVTAMQKAAVEGFGVPLMTGYDVIHGYATIFPVNLGMASAFDRVMIRKHAEFAAQEALIRGINWNFNPMLDVGRDPRWGRVSEGSGEDAYLVGTLGYEYIMGYQSQGMAACVKHLGAYGITRAGRDYTSGDMGRNTLWNQYFEAYKRAFKAKPLTAMASFNAISGVPSHANRDLLQDILRNHWGFDGFVVADWDGNSDMLSMRTHENLTMAGRAALHAGVDMSMNDASFWKGLEESHDVKAPSGRSFEDHMEVAVKRILAVKKRMGLFEDYMPREGSLPILDAEKAAQVAAEKSAILLKNSEVNGKKVLPLTEQSEGRGALWLVGSLASDSRAQQGSWSNAGPQYLDRVVNMYSALEARLGKEAEGNWKYYEGYDKTWTDSEEDKIARDAVVKAFNETSTKPEVIVFVVGENEAQSGEGTSRTNLTMSGTQLTMVKEIHALNQAVTNESERSKLVYVVMAGRPLAISWEAENLNAILYAWNNGNRGGPAVWNLLFGNLSPSGKLPISVPRNVGQIPINYQFAGVRGALKYNQYDSVMSPDRCLPSYNELVESNKTHRIPFGGRCYQSTYLDSPISPLYWFGYGLSYSDFEYANARLSRSQASLSSVYGENNKLTVSVEVRRYGVRNIPSTEIVQVYVRDRRASIQPTWKNLRGYARAEFLSPHPRRAEDQESYDAMNIEIELNMYEDFGFYNEQMEWVVEPGRFDIIIAKNAWDEEHQLPFYVVDAIHKGGANAD